MTHAPLTLAGLSAAGKSTVADLLLGTGEFSFTRSVTTRPPRSENETEYTFVTEEEFSRMKEAGELAESTRYGGFGYGTPVSELDRVAAEGKSPLLILDVVGVASLKAIRPTPAPFAVYLYDDLDVLEERLYARTLGNAPTTEALAAFMTRKEKNVAESAQAKDFAKSIDLFLKNDASPEEAAARIIAAYRAEKRMTEEEKQEAIAALTEQAERKESFRFQR